jgi:hypothetical protein
MAFLESIRLAVTGFLHRFGLNGENVLLGTALFLVSFFGSIALTGALLVRLPPDFLVAASTRRLDRADLRTFLRRLLRHALGVLLILIGLVLMLPGVPGQGLLTIIAGLFISELPGTRRLLRGLLRRPRVLAAVNRLRARYRHPPLEEPLSTGQPS